MSEIDRYLDAEIVGLAIRVGFSYDTKRVASLRENLKARGFFVNESNELVSPGGQSFGDAFGELWEEPAPEEKPAPHVVSAAPANSGPKNIFDAQARERQLVAMLETKQKPSPAAISANPLAPVTPAEIERATGLSPEAFAKLDAERKLEIEGEVKLNRGK
jgi:hypothetical protein